MLKSEFVQRAGMAIVLLAASAFSSATLHASGRHAHRDAQTLAADNSSQNSVLRQHSLPTADDQPNNDADRLVAAQIRRAIVTDDTLALYAQNVKIIVRAGIVTLEGPVRSAEEREELALDAASIVDPGCLRNRVTVA